MEPLLDQKAKTSMKRPNSATKIKSLAANSSDPWKKIVPWLKTGALGKAGSPGPPAESF